MFDVRLEFSKTGNAAYMSHLDLMRALQRAICRAGLPARYSQGFNPHIVLSVLSPLSTGYHGLRELCDFSLEQPMEYDNIVSRLCAVMPAGMRAERAGEPDKKAARICWSDFEIRLGPGDVSAMNDVFAGPVLMEKRSKRGVKSVDLRDYIMGIAFSEKSGEARCRAVLRADADPLNPAYITAALLESGLIGQACAPVYIRHAILDENAQKFF